MRCWALRKDWYRDCSRLAHSISVPELPGSATAGAGRADDGQDDEAGGEGGAGGGVDVPDCRRTVSDPVILPSHATRDRPLPPSGASAAPAPSGRGRGPPRGRRDLEQACSEGDSQDTLDMETECRPEALLEPCRLCRVRPRNGNIIHGRTAHLLTCFSCARKLHKFHAPCPGCGQIIQKVIKTFIA